MEYKKYVDKYFLRTKEILEKEGMNPEVNMQVFIRKGPGKIEGIDEAVELLREYSGIEGAGGHVYGLRDGMPYNPLEPLLHIKAPIQSFVELETLYLGVISAETTKANIGIKEVDLGQVTKNMRGIVDLVGDRPVIYMGARHWRYDEDAEISRAAFDGGANSTSTDIGAETYGQRGVGTTPHAAVLMFGYKYGKDRATVEAARAFDRNIDPKVPRIALVDTFNKEITDSLTVAREVPSLSGVRLDTSGENLGEMSTPNPEKNYLDGNGVTVELAKNVREALDRNGYANKKTVLSSGFGNIEKVKAFVWAEKELGMKLFDSIGVGGIYPSWMATADVVEIEGKPFSKNGRFFRPSNRLEQLL